VSANTIVELFYIEKSFKTRKKNEVLELSERHLPSNSKYCKPFFTQQKHKNFGEFSFNELKDKCLARIIQRKIIVQKDLNKWEK
jgi:hypothetical protein